MDEAAIAAAGIAPLQPFLDRIDAIASIADAAAVVRDLQRHGVDVLHSLEVTADFEDAAAYLVYVGQGGLGLPDRDYYLRDDERSVGIRDAYRAHVAAQLVNLGQPTGRRHGGGRGHLRVRDAPRRGVAAGGPAP